MGNLMKSLLIVTGIVGATIVSASWLPASTIEAREAQMAPYAQTKWVKLSDVRPNAGIGADMMIRLIAIDGEVLLPGPDGE